MRPFATFKCTKRCVMHTFRSVETTTFKERTKRIVDNARGSIPWRVFYHTVFFPGCGRPQLRTDGKRTRFFYFKKSTVLKF